MIRRLFLLVIASFSILQAESLKERYPFSKVIMWGHKLHTHTHSWIHWAFYRAFKHLGYDTYWLDNEDSIDNLDLSNSLFITEGQVDQKIPMREDCHYILHNCDREKYKKLLENGNCINLQVFTYDALLHNVVEVQKFIYIDVPDKVIYMPWATDLLPHEIDNNKKAITPISKKWISKKKSIYWVGTITDTYFDNTREINPFKKACRKKRIKFIHRYGVSMEENIQYIQESFMAPAIVGSWQKEKGYIPCRIFKNISYGQMGVTNSKAVYDLFQGKVVYNADTYRLFYDAKRKIKKMKIQELYDLMDFVRDYHTYINRIEHMLNFFDIIVS